MFKLKGKHSKRIRNLITISTLTAIILSVSTYAWFIGMQSVNVTSFDVEIEATDSLLLSLDGERWSPELTFSEGTLNDEAYAGNKNRWSDLIPMSTVGEMDVDASRMILFEKASFTATAGGYRLMASRVDNTGANEQDGYVVFDLFVRNFSGRAYFTDLNEDDEEGIYLTTNSDVTVAADGVDNTGLENSVRVAFAQIGRVIGTTTNASVITGITCNSDEEDPPQPTYVDPVTGICRLAQIWEPNDKDHEEAAINWYEESCRTRKPIAGGGDIITVSSAYNSGVACGGVADTNAYPTYAINAPIASSNQVDVYDGAEYNSYTSTTKLTRLAAETDTDVTGYFTETMRDLKGTQRPEFMYLAPNSVTKIRVYIYIEGQDIDNYDFSSIGKKISVAFGFTKERFIDTDIEYNGPARDTTRPVIVLADGTTPGDSTVTLTVGAPYVEPNPSYTVTDDVCEALPAGAEKTACQDELEDSVVVNSTKVNTAIAGTYYVTYSAEDGSGNHAALKSRKVIVEE